MSNETKKDFRNLTCIYYEAFLLYLLISREPKIYSFNSVYFYTQSLKSMKIRELGIKYFLEASIKDTKKPSTRNKLKVIKNLAITNF